MQDAQDLFVLDEMMNAGRERDSRAALAAMLGTVPRFDLACVGISIHGLGAVTFEALAHLVCADVVFCYPPTRRHYELLKLINRNAINMHDTLYLRGSPFDPAYDAIINEVIQTVKGGKRVAYATQGSPVFHCGTAVSLHRRAKREGFSSILVSGVSSFELLCAELAEDYDIRNIQICSVRDYVEGTIAINARIPCLLFDLGRYVMPAVREVPDALAGPKLAALTELLCVNYPADYEIVLMYVKGNGSCLKQRTKLIDLEATVMGFGALPTIFFPARQMPS